jgi:3-methyl-2-oxobutanoate hydroxymethyltransferase
MLTCYDATTARWLWRGGVRTMLVGDTAAQMVLGYDSTLPASMAVMIELTAAVRRGAPKAMIMADMPFGSYQCGDDLAMRNASQFLTDGSADWVKLEVDASFAPLVDRMSRAGIAVVAHIGSRPQHVRHEGGFRSSGRTKRDADRIVADAEAMLDAGAEAILIEAVPNEVSQRIVDKAIAHGGDPTPVIGCGAGNCCHGHVVVLHDVLGMTDWQPPFAPPLASVGQAVADAAGQWVNKVASGQYLKDDHPYKMES